MLGIRGNLHATLIDQVFGRASVVVEGWQCVQEDTATFHVPNGNIMGIGS